ncbi:hypothetical protein M0804_009247 [Polistes exclamans]|nr:hypothetical protein M0804_009247 [Polistes exclamans]
MNKIERRVSNTSREEEEEEEDDDDDEEEEGGGEIIGNVSGTYILYDLNLQPNTMTIPAVDEFIYLTKLLDEPINQRSLLVKLSLRLPIGNQSNQEEELSDPDLQDQESGEELPPRPRVAVHPSVLPSNTSGTPLSNLSNLMNSHNPQFLAKLRMEAEADILTTKNSLEVLQAAMNNGVLNLQGFPLPMLPLPNMGIGGMIPQTPSVTTTLPMSVGAEGCSGTATTTQVLNVPMGIGHLDTTSSPSRSKEEKTRRMITVRYEEVVVGVRGWGLVEGVEDVEKEKVEQNNNNNRNGLNARDLKKEYTKPVMFSFSFLNYILHYVDAVDAVCGNGGGYGDGDDDDDDGGGGGGYY